MLEKNRTYTYEELETIIKGAGKKTCEKLDNDMNIARKAKMDIGSMMFSITSMVVTHVMEEVLLGTEKVRK